MNEFPIEEIIKPAMFINPKISFDGKKISYISNENSKVSLVIRDLHSSVENTIFSSNKYIKEYFWINNSKIALIYDTDGNEKFKLIFANIESLEIMEIKYINNRSIEILNNGTPLYNKIYVAIDYEDNEYQDIYCIDIVTQKIELIKKNPGNISDWFIDSKGKVIGGYVSREDGGINFVLLDENNTYKTLINWNVDDIFTSDFIAFSKDSQYVYVKDSSITGTSSIVKIGLCSGKREILYNDKEFDIENVIINPVSGIIDAVSVYKDKRYWLILNKDLDEDITFLNSLDLGDMQIVSRDRDDFIWVLRYEKDVSGESYYLFDRKNKNIQLLFHGRPQLQNYKFFSMDSIEFISRDGLRITGYITIPKEKTSKVPLIVNIHGGPQSRDYKGFNPFVQWIVSQGYGCLQINYRGSVGFGREFIREGYKEWGGKMQDDIIDGINWAIKNHNIDGGRICIYGGSYGGYTALSGATFTPEIFKCAISVNGPSNLLTFLDNMPPFWKKYKECFYKRVGDPEKDRELLIMRSPLFSCERIKSPILIVQGLKDPRVKSSESEAIVEKLKEHKIDHEYLAFSDEGHGIRKNINKVKLYKCIRDFLSTYL